MLRSNGYIAIRRCRNWTIFSATGQQSARLTVNYPKWCFYSLTLAANQEDYFLLFGLPRKFLLDESSLQKSYKKLMVDAHPDKHQSKSPDEQAALEEQASRITHAYQILKLPHTRAVHCLELVGSPLDETSNARLVGPEFLMQIMEFRESIERLPAAYEGADDESLQDLHGMLEEAQNRMQQVFEDLDEALFTDDGGETNERALQLTAQLQYWNRIEETLREKL